MFLSVLSCTPASSCVSLSSSTTSNTPAHPHIRIHRHTDGRNRPMHDQRANGVGAVRSQTHEDKIRKKISTMCALYFCICGDSTLSWYELQLCMHIWDIMYTHTCAFESMCVLNCTRGHIWRHSTLEIIPSCPWRDFLKKHQYLFFLRKKVNIFWYRWCFSFLVIYTIIRCM